MASATKWWQVVCGPPAPPPPNWPWGLLTYIFHAHKINVKHKPCPNRETNKLRNERETRQDYTRQSQTESDIEGDREGDKPAKIVVARRQTRRMDSMERATAARQLAKELEIGHKLSGVQADGWTVRTDRQSEII